MQIFDQVDPNTLDRRELHLWILAHTVIVVLAMGVGLADVPNGLFLSPSTCTGPPVARRLFRVLRA